MFLYPSIQYLLFRHCTNSPDKTLQPTEAGVLRSIWDRSGKRLEIFYNQDYFLTLMIACSNLTLHPKTAPSALQAFHCFKATGLCECVWETC